MQVLKYIFLGIIFGIVLTKSEAISWFRMQEMFRFEGFQMYGIFMTAIPVGAISIWLMRRFRIKTLDGEQIMIAPKKFHKGVILGSLIFGIGWGLTGACPGPIYAQIGTGITVAFMTLLSAVAGVGVYNFFRDTLPH